MFRKIFTLSAVATLAFSSAWSASFNDVSGKSSVFENLSKNYQSLNQKDWKKGVLSSDFKKSRLRKDTDGTLTPSSSWGILYAPNGEQWTYTSDYTYSDAGSIEKVDVSIYDADVKLISQVSMDLELAENETSINYVALVPTITRKFFDIDDAYEIMVYVHATTDDYTGSNYTKVFSLGDGHHVIDIPGNNIAHIDTAPDPWSEKYTMVFMREALDYTDNSYFVYFDVYKRASWGEGCTLDHTFEVDYNNFSGGGDAALPFIINARNNKDIFYALLHYEKPFFDENSSVLSETPEVTPDNNFIIDLYDASFNLVKSTKIPMETKEGYLYSFPGMGELMGFEDLTFGLFNDSYEPVYIVGFENYTPSSEDYVVDLVAYDMDGNKIKTLIEDAYDYIRLSDVEGFERQYCVYTPDEVSSKFYMVNIPAGKVVASIDTNVEGGNSLTTTLDRVAKGDSYMYVSSMALADVDENDNAIHRIAWIDSDGNYDHSHDIKVGNDVAIALPYIDQEAFNPYLFNTDSEYEYMFLVKRYIDGTGASSKTEEQLRIYSQSSQKLLELGPNSETGEAISSVFLANPTLPNGKLMVVYKNADTDKYSINYVNLPLYKFGGGDGTVDNPYLIYSAGDLNKIYTEPNAHYAIMRDIDFSDELFEMNACTFTGSIAGRGHTLSNMKISGAMFENVTNKATINSIKFENCEVTSKNGGAFIALYLSGSTSAAHPTISDIHFYDCKINGQSGNYGAVAAEAVLYSTIEGCVVKNCDFNIGNDGIAGGIVGYAGTSTAINACFVNGNITAPIAGGIIGKSFKGDETIKNCHVDANISAENIAGGIIGESSRSKLISCYVEGEIKATGETKAYAGGIAGYMSTSYEEKPNPTIQNCLVAAKSVQANANAKTAIAHRILGCSSIDLGEIDWDNVTEDMTADEFPHLPGTKEVSLVGNHAIDLDIIDNSIENDATSTEGKSIAFADLTDDLLSSLAWQCGTSIAAPWEKTTSGMKLYFEDNGPTVGIQSVVADFNQPKLIKFDGTSLISSGNAIEVYSIDGSKVAQGNSCLNVKHLAKGTYIARTNNASIKFIVK